MTAIAEAPTVPTSAPASRRHSLALGAVVAGAFVTTLDNTIVNVALPSI